jgi:outer membrane protein assembly factor BamD
LLDERHGALGYTLGPPGDSTETEIFPMHPYRSSRPSLAAHPHDDGAGHAAHRQPERLLLAQGRRGKIRRGQALRAGPEVHGLGQLQECHPVLRGLEARFPFSNQSKQAQLDLIYCYYNDRQIEATVDAATTFERENPTHPRVDYALYMRGLAYFSGESSWYHRWFNADLSKRPPKNLQESFSAFAQLIQRFPNSAYSADARQRMVFLRNRLADYELHVARYYMSRGGWLAAAGRARIVVEQYDGAPAVAESLKIMLDAYRELGMRDHADDIRLVLASNYPETLREVIKEEQKPWYKMWDSGRSAYALWR